MRIGTTTWFCRLSAFRSKVVIDFIGGDSTEPTAKRSRCLLMSKVGEFAGDASQHFLDHIARVRGLKPRSPTPAINTATVGLDEVLPGFGILVLCLSYQRWRSFTVLFRHSTVAHFKWLQDFDDLTASHHSRYGLKLRS